MEELLVEMMNAITNGAVAVGKDTAKQSIKDAYQGLKTLIIQRYGSQAKVEKAIQEVEEEPESKGQQLVLEEQLVKAEVVQDTEVQQQVKDLLALLTQEGLLSGPVYQAKLKGSGAIAQGPGAVAAGAGGIAVGGNVAGNISTGGGNGGEEDESR